jgi:hypothetical protein
LSKLGLVTTCVLVAASSIAYAQPAVQCKTTETQAECHARLKCKADEEIEDCKKRLQKQGAGDPNRTDDGGDRGRDDGGGRDDRGRDDGGRRDDRGRDDGGGGDDYRDDGGRRGGGRGGDGGGRRGRRGSRAFEANKTFGLGLELGEPTGLNGKYFFSPATAFDFGVGAIYGHYYYGDGLHLYGDVLFHPASLVSADAFELPFFIGVGLRYWRFDYCDARICTYRGSAVGVRVPLGVSFDFNRAPIDIAIQLVPVLDFVGDDYYDRYRDRTHFGIDFSVVIRYWFK